MDRINASYIAKREKAAVALVDQFISDHDLDGSPLKWRNTLGPQTKTRPGFSRASSRNSTRLRRHHQDFRKTGTRQTGWAAHFMAQSQPPSALD